MEQKSGISAAFLFFIYGAILGRERGDVWSPASWRLLYFGTKRNRIVNLFFIYDKIRFVLHIVQTKSKGHTGARAFEKIRQSMMVLEGLAAFRDSR